MIKNSVCSLLLFLAFGVLPASAQSASPKLETDEQKTLYALGLLLGGNIESFGLKAEDLEFVKAGLADGATNAKPQVELEV